MVIEVRIVLTCVCVCVCVCVEGVGSLLRALSGKGQRESSGVMETQCFTVWVLVTCVYTYAKMQSGTLKIIPPYYMFWIPIAV